MNNLTHYSEVNINGVSLKEIIDRNLRFVNGDRSGVPAILSGINLPHVDFSGVNLSGIEMEQCNFQGCNFQNCNFTGTSMVGSDFTLCDFRFSFIKRCNFHETNLRYSNFENAIIDDTDFTCVIGNGSQIKSAQIGKMWLVWFSDIDYNIKLQVNGHQHTLDRWTEFNEAQIKNMSGIDLGEWFHLKLFVINLVMSFNN